MIPNLDSVDPRHHDLITEAMRRSLRRNRFGYQFFCRFWLGFNPHEKQIQFAEPRPLTVQSCGSGFGKSVGGASDMLWEGFSNPGNEYAIYAPTNRQVKFIAQDMTDHIVRGKNKLALFIDHKPTQDDPYVGINGSKLWLLNTAYGAENSRGIEVNGVWLDEAAMIKAEAFEIAKTRARRSPGWLKYSSTPKGKQGPFFEVAQLAAKEMREAEHGGGRSGSLLIKAASWDNPHYDRAILERRRATTAKRFWDQEYGGEFVDVQGATFRQADLDRVFDGKWEPETSPRADGLYAHGWDFGRKTTYTVGTTLAYDRLEEVWGEIRGIDQEEHFGEQWIRVFEAVNEREARWSEGSSMSDTILDATGVGDVIDQSIDVNATAFIFTQKSRGEMILRLVQAVETPKRLRLPRSWTALYASMQLHTAKEDAPGETWDHLDSLGLAYWLAFERTSFGTPFARLS